jgi:N-acetylneuraminate synthase
MAQMFDCNVGLSDHTLGIGVAVASVVMGACVIEKHFTLRRADGGVDSAFSLEPHELKLLVEEISRAYQSIGKVSYGISEKEKDSLRFRRSLFVVEDMQEGELFTDKNVRTIRPGYGLAPKYIETVIGKRATCKIARGTPLSWNLFR